MAFSSLAEIDSYMKENTCEFCKGFATAGNGYRKPDDTDVPRDEGGG